MKRKLVNLAIAAAVLIIGYCGYQLYLGYADNKNADLQTELKPEYLSLEETITEHKAEGTQQHTDENNAGVWEVNHGQNAVMDFSQLKNTNSDIAGWITIDNTYIDYPILQSDDNAYYLYRTATKEYSGLGSIFLDYRNNKDFSDFNSILYGHNMSSNKMFGQIVDFKEKSFFDTHKTGTLYVAGKTYQLEIFACGVTKSTSDYYKYGFSSVAEKEDHIKMLKDTAVQWRDSDIGVNDRILALSTCSYEYKDARTVVLAKIV